VSEGVVILTGAVTVGMTLSDQIVSGEKEGLVVQRAQRGLIFGFPGDKKGRRKFRQRERGFKE